MEKVSASDLLLPEVAAEDKIRFVCISDTHCQHSKLSLPAGDVLLHSGDFTNIGMKSEIEDFNTWLFDLPFEYKIVIGGNHDKLLDQKSARSRFIDGHDILTNCTYLQDEFVSIYGYNIYGSPWTENFGLWSFMKSSDEMKGVWELVPNDTDILMTHGPPYGILDRVKTVTNVGCSFLRDTITNRLKISHHIFGHIHEEYGIMEFGETTFINASSCDMHYHPDNPPVVFELLKRH